MKNSMNNGVLAMLILISVSLLMKYVKDLVLLHCNIRFDNSRLWTFTYLSRQKNWLISNQCTLGKCFFTPCRGVHGHAWPGTAARGTSQMLPVCPVHTVYSQSCVRTARTRKSVGRQTVSWLQSVNVYFLLGDGCVKLSRRTPLPCFLSLNNSSDCYVSFFVLYILKTFKNLLRVLFLFFEYYYFRP